MVTHRQRPPGRGQRGFELSESAIDDVNARAVGLLYDMAGLQSNERSRFGYQRAARVIARVPTALRDLIASGELEQLRQIGPSSSRILRELLEHGYSPSVQAALERSTRQADVAHRRTLRKHFLSEHAMREVLSAPMPPAIVNRETFRGDFQMHTRWSDGAESIATMVQACMSRGETCMGVTDHSHGLPVARGMSMAAALEQHREIDRVNAQYRGRFRVFKGIEANIRADGALDLSDEERRVFEFVVASPHALLRRAEDQTRRMLAAVRAPGVAILGHPRGRIYNSRGGVVADWRRVFAAAAEREVAIELDGNWHRQDLDWELAAQALEAGCLFALDSDAHSIEELRYTDYALAHARLARIPWQRVINCWSDERLSQWMRARWG